MRTDDLVAALARDARVDAAPIGRGVLLAALVALSVAVLTMQASIRIRPDMLSALSSPLFLAKLAAVASLAVAALAIAAAMAQPGSRVTFLLLVPAGLFWLAAVAFEITTQPLAALPMRLVGKNAVACLTLVPIYAFLPFGLFVLALRRGAPLSPKLAGAMAGLAAGAVGAFAYGLHCDDDSPFFVALWYGLAVAIVTIAGARLGPRLLRW